MTEQIPEGPPVSPVCLVIAGGSVRGFGMLGAIQYLDELYDIHKIHAFMGTSIGSIISYMLCIGMKPLEIVHSVLRGKILERIQSDITIDQIWEQQGIAQFDCIVEELELITLAKFGRLFTMKSLYEELGKELGCVTFNFTQYRTVLLHHTTTPDVPCLVAIQMSSSIPFVFNKCVYNNCVYIDGGVVDNFPIRMALRFGKKNIIGVVVDDYGMTTEPETPQDGTISISKLISIPTVEKTHKTVRKYRKRFTIINVKTFTDIFNFNLDVPEIMEMFSNGYKSARAHIGLINSPY
jgi:predicted acylesterase/phospholipase RssA